jgi:hypothetical protein
MTFEELRQAAIDYLGKALNASDNTSSPALVQAAVGILVTPKPDDVKA